MSEWLQVSETAVICNRMPVEPVRLAICEWLRCHGIDPNDACVPGYVVRWPVERQVEFESYDRDDKGKIRIDASGNDALRVTRFVQLEAPPLPWPRIVAIHQDPIPPGGSS